MANRISNRRALTLRTAALANPPLRVMEIPPLVYTPITTPAAQPVSSGGVSVWNGVTTSLGRER